MLKKSTAALALAILLLSVLPASAAFPSRILTVTFGQDRIAEGRLTADAVVQRVGSPERAVVSMGYYRADGTLVCFDAKAVELETVSQTVALCQGTAGLEIDVPDRPEEGDYVKVIAMSASSLEPYIVNGECVLKYSPSSEAETEYEGIYERYYTLETDQGSLAISSGKLTVAGQGTQFRLKDMSEDFVAFVDASSGGQRRLSYDGETLGRRLYGFGGSSMLWRLVPHGDKYYIEHSDGGYLAVENGEAVISAAPCEFSLVKQRETPFTLMTSLDGYKLLSDAEKQRITEIYTSVGAEIFPSGTNSDSILDTAEAAFETLYSEKDSLTPQQQKERILEIAKTPPSYNSGETDEISAVSIGSLPGGGADVTKADPVSETIYIWDTGEKEYTRVDVTYTGFGHSQTVKFYYDETGAQNAETAILALARFPYEYRQFLEQVNVYVPSGSFTYNCDHSVLTVRVQDGTGIETMARNIAHELGHSVDFCANGNPDSASYHWSQGEKWQQAVEADMLAISKYGNQYDEVTGERNYYEEFAEFSRLYFQSYGNRDRQIGIKQLFPNQLASFERMLDKIGMEPLY